MPTGSLFLLILILFQYLSPILFLAGIYFIGNRIMSKHEAQLSARQLALHSMQCSDLKSYIDPNPEGVPPTMVSSEVTLGIDHFRGLIGRLKNIVGGNVYSYQRTLERARKEAITRVLENARASGYNAVANIRVEFVDISGKAVVSKQASMVTILAYGTAYIRFES